jgi:YHS domain-containing protein
MMVDERTAPRSEYKGKTYYFMNPTHQAMFAKDPARYIEAGTGQHGMQGMRDMKN